MKELFSVQEVAKLLDMSHSGVLYHIKNGSLKSTQVGKIYIISKEDFADCLAGLPSLEKSAKLSESAKDYAVIGAPTIFINDSLIVGARPYEDYVDSNGDKVDGLKTIIERIK